MRRLADAATIAVLVCITSMPIAASAQESAPATAIPEPDSREFPDVAAEIEPAASQDIAPANITIPKLHPVVIEILEPLGSKASTSLDRFPIRLAQPIVVDGIEVVPAGATGEGEVVHAKKAGGMGAAGELVLAARFLDVDGRQMRLRSFSLEVDSNSKVDTVNTLAVASAATVVPVALVGFLIKGGQVDIPAGTLASAKLAAPFEVAVHGDTGDEAQQEFSASQEAAGMVEVDELQLELAADNEGIE